MSYNQTLSYLYNLQKHGIRPGLERMCALLSQLHDPHQQFPSMHIGGTNGKGSTAAMTACILMQAGYRVGLYTSPHLIDFTERITINGVPIPEDAVVRYTEQIRSIVSSSLTLTFFEFITAVAFCYFAGRVDIAVIEVGLGGRFDATNVLTPRVTAITQVDMDHQNYLGTTLREIAFEKAGIIKEGVPIVTGVTQPEVIQLIEERARTCHAPLVRVGPHPVTGCAITVAGENPFLYRGVKERTLSCPLLGRHQIYNTAIAVGMIETLQTAFSVSDQDILEGIRQVKWPGRLQVIKTDPLILIDGAHNPAGAGALSDFLQTVDPRRLGRHILIVGILSDKDISGILDPITGWADEIVLTRPDIERAADWDTLRAALKRPIPTTVQPSVPCAIAYAESKLHPSDTLVVTGSLYTVGEALAHFRGVAPSPLRG